MAAKQKSRQARRNALVRDIKKLVSKHRIVLDKYSANEETRYFLKLQPYDIEIDIEEVFFVIPHQWRPNRSASVTNAQGAEGKSACPTET